MIVKRLTGKAAYLKTRGRMLMTIKTAGQQLSFDWPASEQGTTISIVYDEEPEQIVGDFKREGARKDAGLSLTETLVVLAILLVLGAIMIPPMVDALQSVKELLALVNQVVPMK